MSKMRKPREQMRYNVFHYPALLLYLYYILRFPFVADIVFENRRSSDTLGVITGRCGKCHYSVVVGADAFAHFGRAVNNPFVTRRATLELLLLLLKA